MSRKGRVGKEEMKMGLRSKGMFRALLFATGASLLLFTPVAEAAGVGTPANFENAGIYGGFAMSFAIDPDNTNVLYVGMGSGYGVYKSTNAGTNWIGNSAFEDEKGWVYIGGLAVAPSNRNIIFASDYRTLKKSIDGGSIWSALFGYTGEEINSIVIHPTNSEIIYLGSGEMELGTNDDAKVWKTDDGGTTWSSSLLADTAGSKDTLVGKVTIDPSNPDTIYAVTGSVVYTAEADLAKGNIFKSINGGNNWTAKYPDGGAGGQGWFADVCVDPTASNIIFAAGKVGIVKSINGGDSWSTVLTPEGNGFCSVVVDKNDYNIVYAAEPRGPKVYKSTDGGGTWSNIYSEMGMDTQLFIDPNTTTTLYAIDSIGVKKSTDSGDNWTAVNNGIDAIEVISSAVDSSNKNIIYVATESGYIVKTMDKGSNWSVIHTEFFGIPALAIDPNSTQIIYAGNRGTSILKSIDGGANWTDMMTLAEYETAFSLSVNPSMMMVDPNNSNNVYICQRGQTGDPTAGNIHKSTDGGNAWNTGLLPANNPVLSMAIKPSDSNTIYVGRNDKGDFAYRGVVKTINGGTNWTSKGLTTEIISCLMIDPNNEEVLYAGTEADGEEGDGKIYKTTDAGDNWIDKTPSGCEGDFETIVIDSSDSNIVYAGTCGGYLYKSTDAGSNWTLLTDAFISVKTLMIGSLYAGTGGGLYKYSPAEGEIAAITGGGGGGCFIATASFGTPMAEEVKALTKFRDEVLLKTTAGRDFVELYYKTSPPIANFIRNKPALKAMVRIGLKPLVWFSRLVK